MRPGEPMKNPKDPRLPAPEPGPWMRERSRRDGLQQGAAAAVARRSTRQPSSERRVISSDVADFGLPAAHQVLDRWRPGSGTVSAVLTSPRFTDADSVLGRQWSPIRWHRPADIAGLASGSSGGSSGSALALLQPGSEKVPAWPPLLPSQGRHSYVGLGELGPDQAPSAASQRRLSYEDPAFWR
eukprot:gnl/TRDRNA2_/TRDRNA2_134533_c1_seq4.p1 gnl/TRDRNA2_/TRDRNA2_134533_c1~~gnl/TRDRNA2_/TRDRNA2_134533_c1_seq4.p1  ORF type:complete len:184 (+),score=15.67 gnl/TRDRNA2_/TRDRNA2_134533_c1_seq4:68-619(+)